jgi:anti-anti-sigma regulatory factor
LLKNVFKGAAHTVVVNLQAHALSQDYQRKVAGGMKDKLALLTLARRIAAVPLIGTMDSARAKQLTD